MFHNNIIPKFRYKSSSGQILLAEFSVRLSWSEPNLCQSHRAKNTECVPLLCIKKISEVEVMYSNEAYSVMCVV